MLRVAMLLLAGMSLLPVSARGSEPPPRPAMEVGQQAPSHTHMRAGRPAFGITLPRPTHRIVEPRPTARLLVPEPRSREVVPELPGRMRMAPAVTAPPAQEQASPPAQPPMRPAHPALPGGSAGAGTARMAGALAPRMDDPQPAFGPETFAATARAADNYRMLQRRGGWPLLEEQTGLAEGASGEKVLALKQILSIQGDLSEQAAADQRYGPETAEAIRRFEFRHGLPQTGMVSGATLAALRIPALVRQSQLQASSRRLGVTQFDFGGRYLVINRAAGKLEVVSNGIVLQRHAVRVPAGFEGPDTIAGTIPGIVAGAGGLRVPVEGAVPHALVPARIESGRMIAAPADGEVAVLGLPALAAWLMTDPDLPDEPVVDAAGLIRLVQEPQARTLALRRPVGVASVYLTGFSGRDGMVRFRPDPLGLDMPAATAQR